MIKIQNLNFGYEGEELLNNINLDIHDGDFLAIIGHNGSGKSTLIKCLIGINKVAHESILIDDTCISCFNSYSQIGYVEQITNAGYTLPISAYEMLRLISNDKKRIKELVETLNISEFINDNYNDLSGGQRQRINIAISLLKDIKYLIMDEPTTGLDVKSRNDLYDLLKKLNDQGITIIVVSHNLEELSFKPNKIYDITKKQLVGDSNA